MMILLDTGLVFISNKRSIPSMMVELTKETMQQLVALATMGVAVPLEAAEEFIIPLSAVEATTESFHIRTGAWTICPRRQGLMAPTLALALASPAPALVPAWLRVKA